MPPLEDEDLEELALGNLGSFENVLKQLSAEESPEKVATPRQSFLWKSVDRDTADEHSDSAEWQSENEPVTPGSSRLCTPTKAKKRVEQRSSAKVMLGDRVARFRKKLKGSGKKVGPSDS